ncbi:acyl-CoA/acyl-ACP dehydrogenase [Duganella sp. sic0402]|uniref:acyl-CoA dehydrogenase family protein n=1 Tax=Duganella sp. sic0402 TaxID=2854786 RepID=UPI001C4934E4|nr:acyl-CoA dehydrogenase family protein [Duganella sp. sic0402]MBV7535788.1 acyl-CoA/acyl-ACP dehydrogenase [Duganella sp. sic0402]
MADLHDWLTRNAETLDQTETLNDEVLPALAAHGCFRAGVPLTLGGEPGLHGDVRDAILGIADVARYSVTAAFVYWGQRSFIEYLLQSSNSALRDRLLPSLLDGTLAGATGLSNAMKFLSGMEPLSVHGTANGDGWTLQGKLAWITNLRAPRFVAAAAVAPVDNSTPLVAIFASDDAGVERSANLPLIALRGSNTAAVQLDNVAAPADDIIATQAPEWLAHVRPAFLGMQCGMSLGLATAALEKAAAVAAKGRGQLSDDIAAARQTLAEHTQQLLDGVADGRFVTAAPLMFKLRIAIADLVQQAVTLELQAKGGHAYLMQEEDGFARRWRESAFIPVITPSITQLQAALAKHAATQ